MSKPKLLFRGPVETRSGYGSHARDILECLRKMDLYDIEIDSCLWGVTPKTALEENNEFHQWIKTKIVNQINYVPDIYITVTISNEFQRMGKYNIGITAGVETTIVTKDLIDGVNRMDLTLVPSKFTRDVYLSTVFNETEQSTGKLIRQHRVMKPMEVLFEGVNTSIYNDNFNGNIDLNIDEDFAFLFVGHWLKGELGQDRKDVGMLIKIFSEVFKNYEKKPALVLKTQVGSFSVKDRELVKKKIADIVGNESNVPPIYLVYGDLTDEEMNNLYNHPKIKTMISITKGEGFGRPLLEFTMTGKPVIASNWSGHKDFLPTDKSIMLGGELKEVHPSATDVFIVKDSKWFTANYNEVGAIMQLIIERYGEFVGRAEELKEINKTKFSMDKMQEELQKILTPFTFKPEKVELKLPKLTKVNE